MADEFKQILMNLCDMVRIHTSTIDQLGEKLEQSNTRLVERIDDLAVQIGNQAQNIDRLERSIGQLTENIAQVSANIDRTNSNLEQRFNQIQSSIDGHLRVSEAQSANVAELTKLVATQAATVNKLLDRQVA